LYCTSDKPLKELKEEYKDRISLSTEIMYHLPKYYGKTAKEQRINIRKKLNLK